MLSVSTRLVLTAAFLAAAGLTACGPTSPSTQPSSTPTGSSPSTGSSSTPTETVAFAEIKTIMDNRCVACHAQAPTRPGFNTPAGGTSFETPAQIQSQAERINLRVQSRSMPQGNVTGMTDAERARIKLWFEQGAKL